MQVPTTLTDMTYRYYIEREFKARCRRNPSYSLRAYARDLQVAPSKLSEVLRRTCGLSSSSAQTLASKLKLTEKECEYFVTSVEAEHSRSANRKHHAQNLLKQFKAVHGFTDVDLEKFKIISEWYYNGILEVLMLDQFVSTPEWIARQLDIDVDTTIQALARLEKFELIKNEDGKWVVNNKHTTTTPNIPSREIREHHFQVLKKATDSIEDSSIDERDLSSIVMAIDAADFPKIQNKIREFRRALAQELQAGSVKNRVYNLAIQFFPLTKKHGQE